MANAALITPEHCHAPASLRARLEAAVEAAIAALDALDGDSDLEDASEDEGAQVDAEADLDHLCNWQDEGDQSRLLTLPVNSARVGDQ